MGVVYLAEQRFPRRKVALKVLAPELARDERFRDRFVRESNLAASLDHPNIVPIHAAGEEDGLLYLAMRYVQGTDLKQVIADGGPLSLARTAAIVGQVASALDAAHRRGIIHRDVKASNVLLVTGDGSGAEHAYLSDFGLTKRMTSDSGLTGTGQFVGTLDYAAPEQFEGSRWTPEPTCTRWAVLRTSAWSVTFPSAARPRPPSSTRTSRSRPPRSPRRGPICPQPWTT
jgi:serine/threonine protein kinase